MVGAPFGGCKNREAIFAGDKTMLFLIFKGKAFKNQEQRLP